MRLNATVTFTPRGDLGRFVRAKVTPAVQRAVDRAAAATVARAKALCPVDTGALRESIDKETVLTDSTVVSRVTASQPYAGYVEYGTGIRGAASPGKGPYPYDRTWPGMTAQPFMRPALAETRAKVKDAVRQELSVELQR